MHNEVSRLAYMGDWKNLLDLIRRRPHLVNAASEPKGYTPLHQAAWHGSGLTVVGELLALGADPTLRTRLKNQSPREIAFEKHPDRDDLQFLLHERPRTLAQLMRKIAAEHPNLFDAYDGNQVLFDRLIVTFGSDSCCVPGSDFKERLASAFAAITGRPLARAETFEFGPSEGFRFEIDPNFWSNRIGRLLGEVAAKAPAIPLEQHWVTLSDIFDPEPTSWGLRGSLFLWMEMKQLLGQIPLPQRAESIEQTIASAYATLTGELLSAQTNVTVRRYDRGGMSSGMISGEWWAATYIPLMQRRARWLSESWAWDRTGARSTCTEK
ncbi:hypothetical protein CR51_21930 [Caballeronia megalochromosomata]|nr:hypothetical protein CR51_21930 [Caballeronia megalochromosomata]